MNISQSFKDFRERQNLTQKELAEKIGVTHQMISQIERGFRPPSVKNIIDIALVFNCTSDEILGLVKPSERNTHLK